MPIKKLPKGKTAYSLPPKNPLWDLYRDGLTQSAIATFLTCREHFYLQYLEGYTPIGTTFALQWGTLVHEVLAMVLRPSNSLPLDKALAKVKRKCSVDIDEKQKKELDFTLKKMEVVLDEYLKFWHKHNKGLKWIKREETFCVDYYPYGKGSSFTPVKLRGRWDGVYKVGKGVIGVYDTKNYSQVNDWTLQVKLRYDLQMMFYSLAAELSGLGSVRHATYDVLRRPGLELTQKDKTVGNFLARLRKHIQDGQHTTKGGNVSSKYFYRYDIEFHPTEISEWRSNILSRIIVEIERWYQGVITEGRSSPFHYLTPAALDTKYGLSGYAQAITTGTTAGLLRRKVCFPELED